MKILTGTSGFDYAAWKGSFYPEDLPAKGRLGYYGEQLKAVEINATFYRMPKRDTVAKWAASVPEQFSFVLKASRRITHFAKLADCGEALGFLWKSASELGSRLGPLLFQLPPTFKADVPRLEAFAASLPEGMRAALEVRNPTWNTPEVHDVLGRHRIALVVADSEAERTPPIVPTAEFGYFRMRREAYEEADLRALAERIAQQPWTRCFVFFKHEDGGIAPRLARTFPGLFDALS